MRRKADGTDKQIAERVRVRRAEIGMSQKALADRLDVSFQQVQKYERGTNRITAGRLVTIAKELGVPITYFYDGLQTGGTVYVPSTNAHVIARAYDRIPTPRGKKLATEVMRFLAGPQ